MIRLHFVVEGQTEETFVNRLLAPHLGYFDISADARQVETSRNRNRIFRGGLREYQKLKRDLERWMREDQHSDSYFTTMIDLYALPSDFPKRIESRSLQNIYERITLLEKSFLEDVQHSRFIPYIQLHEFETLLLSDPSTFDWSFINHDRAIETIQRMCDQFEHPELINDHPDTAPSKRIIKEIPEYQGQKSSAGIIIAEKIGLTTMRQKCRHFDEWIHKLESLATSR